MNRSDGSGFWGTDDHRRLTRYLAGRLLGWSAVYVNKVGKGAYDTDAKPKFGPGSGHWDYHFDANDANRWYWHQLLDDTRHQFYARWFYSGVRLAKKGSPGNGVYYLGLALHAYPQDYYAHGYLVPQMHEYMEDRGFNPDFRWWQPRGVWALFFPPTANRWQASAKKSKQVMRAFMTKTGRSFK